MTECGICPCGAEGCWDGELCRLSDEEGKPWMHEVMCEECVKTWVSVGITDAARAFAALQGVDRHHNVAEHAWRTLSSANYILFEGVRVALYCSALTPTPARNKARQEFLAHLWAELYIRQQGEEAEDNHTAV